MSIRPFKEVPKDLREWSRFFRDTTVNATGLDGVLALDQGGTGATTAATARSALGLGTMAVKNNVTNIDWSGSAMTVANGGTGSSSVAGALTSLGAAAKSTGSFTATLTGCTTTPTGTVVYSISGSVVVLAIPQINATSNTTAATLTGGPAPIQPARIQVVPLRLQDNSVVIVGYARVETSGVVTLFPTVALGNFTAAGTKGTEISTVTYALD